MQQNRQTRSDWLLRRIAWEDRSARHRGLEQAKAKQPELVEDLKVHKPYIDAVSYLSPFHPDGRMHRVSEVIDCWYDSGAMPFAQWGYPHQNREEFADQFPADFISEALDQTRGLVLQPVGDQHDAVRTSGWEDY